MPKLNQLVENQVALNKISTDYRKADDKLADLNKLAKNQTLLDETKKTVVGYLPDNPDASDFIISLESMTSKIPIIIESLSVNEIKAAKTAKASTTNSDSTSKTSTAKTATKTAPAEKALEFDASIKTTYDKISIFFSQMESMSRFNTIENVTIGNYNPDDSTLDFNTSGKIYYGK